MNKILSMVQKVVSEFRALILAVVVNALVALIGSFGFHMSGESIAVITSLVSAGLAWFVGEHFAAKLAAARAGQK